MNSVNCLGVLVRYSFVIEVSNNIEQALSSYVNKRVALPHSLRIVHVVRRQVYKVRSQRCSTAPACPNGWLYQPSDCASRPAPSSQSAISTFLHGTCLPETLRNGNKFFTGSGSSRTARPSLQASAARFDNLLLIMHVVRFQVHKVRSQRFSTAPTYPEF